MENLSAILALLERVVDGAEPSEIDLDALVWNSEDLAVNAAAKDAWLALRRFIDDDDIRARDKKYDVSLRQGLNYRADELAALQRGEDPCRRRASRLHRLLWQMGIV